MFSTCSELTPRAPIPDGRMERIMHPCWCVSMTIFIDKRTDQQTNRIWEFDIRTGFFFIGWNYISQWSCRFLIIIWLIIFFRSFGDGLGFGSFCWECDQNPSDHYACKLWALNNGLLSHFATWFLGWKESRREEGRGGWRGKPKKQGSERLGFLHSGE